MGFKRQLHMFYPILNSALGTCQTHLQPKDMSIKKLSNVQRICTIDSLQRMNKYVVLTRLRYICNLPFLEIPHADKTSVRIRCSYN